MADDPALPSPSAAAAESEPLQETAAEDVCAEPGRVLPYGLTVGDLAWLSAIGLGFAVAFGPEFIWMFGRWLNSPYYGHGLLVPVVSAYLMFRRRDAVRGLVSPGDRLGLVAIIAGLVMHLLAVQVDVNFASCFAAIVVLWGVIAWVWGRPVALALLFPVAYLGFMVPVDRLLIDAFASPLQLLSAEMAGGFAQAIGVPVTRDGVNLGVPGYTFEVAVPCSGLKSLITMLALGTLYAHLVKARLWQRLALVAGAVPIALLANVGRVTLTLLLARSMGARIADGFFHSLSGVLVFALGLLGLYGLGRLLKCHALRSDF
jgi:exosortase